MFHSVPRPPRPFLLLIVYGLFIAIVGVTATAQSIMVALNFSNSALNATVGNDAATIQTWANGFLRPSDLGSGITAERRSELNAQLVTVADRAKLARIEVRGVDGQVILSNDPAAVGSSAPLTSAFTAAASGSIAPTFVARDQTEAAGAPLGVDNALREYLPLLDKDGKAAAVIGVWRDAAPILAQLDNVRRDVVLVTLTAALIAAALLYLIFRSAQGRITRQTTQLLEATRRDPLTGTLNHGALVVQLADAIESARAEGGAIGVALIDIDGFRLLNDTYGHEAGDFALMEVVRLLGRHVPGSSVFGRYGPDEFLVIAPTSDVVLLEPSIDELRTGLADAALQFDVSERLPLSISAGIAAFPTDATSVTALLSMVAVTLAEAKASGGDAVRVAGRVAATAAQDSFDVLQGLVFAVDTKDRYTKRHSEDVARYGLFLARQLGLDDDFLGTLRTAGLLHDIGKIGIPDTVLRKPGVLTAGEYDIVKHHVALGDMIVRDLPNIDVIRAGIRHHHERWDGKGYLTGLAAEEIPLIARILAVGDAFSAMTTTRPYRKALSVLEALHRLEDAAGTQLDEQLVRVFVNAIETVPGAPLPGDDSVTLTTIWTPRSEVA